MGRRLFLLLFLSIGSSAYLLFLRIATVGGVPTLGFIFWHCLGGTFLMVAIVAVRRTRVPMGREHLRFYAVSALLGLAIPYLGITIASPKVPVGVLSMTITIEPAITYLLALVLLLERYRTLRFLGLLLGIAGLMLIVLPEASLPSREMVPWVLIGLAMPIGGAIWSNWIAYARPPAVDAAAATLGLLGLGTVMLLPAVIAMDELWWFDAERIHLWWLIPVFAVLNVWVWFTGFVCVRVAGPVFYSVWPFVTTPMTMAVGMVIFGEKYSAWIWGALVILLTSLYLVNLTMASARLQRVE
jgi:drug/metabolite transporter (DMT)-like permease